MGGGSEVRPTHDCNQQFDLIRPTHDCNQQFDLIRDDRTVSTCNGCKMDVYGPRFVCKLCDKTLHKVCRYPEQTISHDFFDHSCMFTFDEGSLGEVPCKFCVACGKDVRGFNYHCAANNLTPHPICYKLDKKVTVDDKVFNLCNKLVSNCLGCDINYVKASWAYVSTCNISNFHVHCLKEYEFNVKNQRNLTSAPPANKVEMSDFDSSSPFETKTEGAKGSIEKVPMQEKVITTTNELGLKWLFGRISKVVKTMYHKAVSGITSSCQKVLNAARRFFFYKLQAGCVKRLCNNKLVM